MVEDKGTQSFKEEQIGSWIEGSRENQCAEGLDNNHWHLATADFDYWSSWSNSSRVEEQNQKAVV